MLFFMIQSFLIYNLYIIYFSYESEIVFEDLMFTLYLNLHLCLQSINFQSSTIYNHKTVYNNSK